MSASVTERIDRIVSESPIGLSAASRIFGTFPNWPQAISEK
jgi:hypothetical protein